MSGGKGRCLRIRLKLLELGVSKCIIFHSFLSDARVHKLPSPPVSQRAQPPIPSRFTPVYFEAYRDFIREPCPFPLPVDITVGIRAFRDTGSLATLEKINNPCIVPLSRDGRGVPLRDVVIQKMVLVVDPFEEVKKVNTVSSQLNNGVAQSVKNKQKSVPEKDKLWENFVIKGITQRMRSELWKGARNRKREISGGVEATNALSSELAGGTLETLSGRLLTCEIPIRLLLL